MEIITFAHLTEVLSIRCTLGLSEIIRSAKSANVVPTVVVAMIVIQYRWGVKPPCRNLSQQE